MMAVRGPLEPPLVPRLQAVVADQPSDPAATDHQAGVLQFPPHLLVWTAPDGIERARLRSLLISDKGNRPWNRLVELGWTRRSTLFSFTG
jgi:hypothetical protein